MIIHEHPIPQQWEIGQCEDHGGVDGCVVRVDTGRYCVELAGNVMNCETGEFKRAEVGVTPCIYPSLASAFEAFKKFYL